MKKLREGLEALLGRLKSNSDKLAVARRRHRKYRNLAQNEHERQKRAERHNHNLRAAFYKRRAEARQRKSIFWKGRIKQELDRVGHLEKSVQEREADIAKWEKEHGPRLVAPNKIRGGTPSERLRLAIHVAALNYRKGHQPGYYSQSGAPRSYRHGLENYPFGHIWDCSTFADAMYFVCGLDSPSGPGAFRTGGFTGTELAHGHQVSASQARSGDLVIYLMFSGDRTGHHVEVIDDPVRQTTIGHGDSAINSAGPGYDLFGDGLYEIRTYH